MSEVIHVLAIKDGGDWVPVAKGSKALCLDAYHRQYENAWREGIMVNMFKLVKKV